MQYLIDIANPLLALDIRGAIALHDPEAGIVDLSILDNLVPPMPCRTAALLITTRRLEELERHPAIAAFEDGGGRILVLDGIEDPAEKARTGWTFLNRPVTEPDLVGGIARAMR